MNNLKLRIELSRQKNGIPINDIGTIFTKTAHFLTAVSQDAGIHDNTKNWTADNFTNGSLICDCTQENPLQPKQIIRTKQIIRNIMNNNLSDPELNLRIRPTTRKQYANIANNLPPEETIRFGLYTKNPQTPSEWHTLTKTSAEKIITELPPPASYYGEIQGIIHALYKESKPQKLVLRELSTGKLIDCFFEPDKYQAAIQTLHKQNAIIFIEGEITENRTTNTVKSIQITNFHNAPTFDKNLFENLIGNWKNYTAEQTTEKFIQKIRSDA